MAPTLTPSPNYPPVKLPHPFLTSYRVRIAANTTPAKLVLTLDERQPEDGRPLKEPLHLDTLSWLDLTNPPKDACPPPHDNSPWARARRSPSTEFSWSGPAVPPMGPVWNVIHAIYLAHPTCEYFRLSLAGPEKEILRDGLLATGLAIEHPKPRWDARSAPAGTKLPVASGDGELLILRSSFWQGAASPMGPRPIWAVGDGTDSHLRLSLDAYPVMPEHFQITNRFPEGEPVFTRHPTRRPKPRPGSIIYSRYIPELDQHFSLEAVDWQNQEHLELFNKWQNDPRVAAGWNETGTLDEHREYLRKLHVDPHVLCLFGRFDKSRFSYYELYWAKVGPPLPSPRPSFRLDTNSLYPGGPLRRTLRGGPLRPRAALAGGRRVVPRAAARQRVVLELHPLLLPRRPAHGQRGGRAARDGRHHPVVRELAGPDSRLVHRPRSQAVGALGVQQAEVVPVEPAVLGRAGEAARVLGSGGVECEVVDSQVCSSLGLSCNTSVASIPTVLAIPTSHSLK